MRNGYRTACILKKHWKYWLKRFLLQLLLYMAVYAFAAENTFSANFIPSMVFCAAVLAVIGIWGEVYSQRRRVCGEQSGGNNRRKKDVIIFIGCWGAFTAFLIVFCGEPSFTTIWYRTYTMEHIVRSIVGGGLIALISACLCRTEKAFAETA